MEPVKLPPLLQDWVDAQNGRDAARHAALYTEDGVLEDVANGFKAEGRQAIAAFLAKATQGFAEVVVEVLSASVSERAAAIEYTFSATNRGMIPIPGAKNKRFTSRAVTFFELRAGQITRSSDYYDTGAVIAQLGVPARMVVGLAQAFAPRRDGRR